MKEIDLKITHQDIWPVWYKRFWWTITFRRKKYRKKLRAVWIDYEKENVRLNNAIMKEHTDDVHDFNKMY